MIQLIEVKNANDNYDMYNLPDVYLGNNFDVKKLVIHERHICGLSQNKMIKCWGFNMFEALGISADSSLYQGDRVGDENNEMYSLTTVNLPDKVKDIGISLDNTCVILINGNITCFGRNTEGLTGGIYGVTSQLQKEYNLRDNFIPKQISTGGGAFYCVLDIKWSINMFWSK